MRAYQNLRFWQYPDVADIFDDGRKSCVGRIRRGEGFRRSSKSGQPTVYKVCHNDRGYCSPRSKAVIRRYLKRIDRRLGARYEALAEA